MGDELLELFVGDAYNLFKEPYNFCEDEERSSWNETEFEYRGVLWVKRGFYF
jgi:hypothetical protein